MPQRHRARLRSALATLLALVALTACGGDSASNQTGDRRPQVVIAEGADLSKPSPIVSESSLDNQVNAMLYMSMLGPAWRDGILLYQTADENPLALARSYEFFGADSASLRYRMRSDVQWTDGTPVTARDAAFSLRVQGMEEVASPRQDYNRDISEIVVEDDSTLVVHFSRRYPEVFFHTAGAIIPRHIYEGSDLAQMRSHPSLVDPAANLVTNGPMRLSRWVRGQSVTLTPNPDFEPQAEVDIVFRIIPEEATRMIELQTGGVDVAQVPFNFVADIRADDKLRIEAEQKRSYEYIAYNPQAHDFFADRDTRRALSLALDSEELIAALQMEEFAIPAGGPYSPIFQRLYDAEAQAPAPYDTVQAMEILASKGWRRGTDGILTRNGERFSFELMTNGDNRRRVDIAQIAERQWRRLGIETRIQTLEFNTAIERTQSREFDAYIGGWGVGLSPDLYQLWGAPDLPFNFVGYDNPQVQALFEQAVNQPTEEAAAQYWRRAAARIAADQPYTWLYYLDRLFGVNNRLQGILVDVLSPYGEVWNWRVVS